MNILISGASGFIGSHVVDEVMRRGHHATAIVRGQIDDSIMPIAGLRRLVWDLSDGSTPDLSGLKADCIIHLAASLGGSRDEQERTMLGGTSRLLDAARQAGIGNLVGISSIAVVDYQALPSMAVVDESAPLANDPGIMGTYAALKVAQEEMFMADALKGSGRCVILRPGIVYDETRLISAHAGIIKGPVRLLIAHEGQVPTVEVHGLAHAIVTAAERELPDGTVLHLVDDNLPGQADYLAGLRRRGLLPGGGMVLPWLVASGLARLAWFVFSLFGRAGKLPEALCPHAFASRFKPFRYSNAKARELLDWQPGNNFF